ncbi:hypothetical protein [Pseudoalteromonas gelatinilytica]
MFTNRKTLLAMSVASVFALSGCSSDDDKNEVVPDPVVPPVTEIVPPDTIVTEQPAKVFSANVIDLSNSDALEGAMVTFLVDGEAATSLTDVNGEDLNMVTVDDSGNFTFLSKEGASGEVTAKVTYDGYVTKSFIVDLDAEVEDGSNDIPLQFGLISSETDGLAQASTEAELTDATTVDAITANASKDGANSNVTVPAGTTLKDANGDAISGGTVSLKVLAADSSKNTAGVIIPEGLNTADAAAVATPVGVTDITMSAGDTKIKQFDPAIDVSVVIPADSGVAVNDMLDLASYNEDTGLWQQELNKATISSMNADGSYNASFSTNHLTFFSVNKTAPVCQSGVSINVTSGTVPPRGLAVLITSADASVGGYLRGSSKQLLSANTTTRYGISADATANVRVYDYSGNDWYNSNGEVQVCGTINVDLGNPVETFDTNLTLAGTCSADSSVTPDLSGSVVTYAKNGKAASVAKSAGNSTFNLTGLEVGASYTVRATIRGAQVASGGQSQVFTFTDVQSGTNLNGDVAIQCEEREVTGTN